MDTNTPMRKWKERERDLGLNCEKEELIAQFFSFRPRALDRGVIAHYWCSWSCWKCMGWKLGVAAGEIQSVWALFRLKGCATYCRLKGKAQLY